MARTLLFDIDGTLLNYDDNPKPRLLGGAFEKLLKEKGFDRLICVSGWCNPDPYALESKDQEYILRYSKSRIWTLYRDLDGPCLRKFFTDHDWAQDILGIVLDTDRRAKYLDLNSDYLYIDDWAHEFFLKEHSQEAYEEQTRLKKVLQVDPEDDGQQILDHLESLSDITENKEQTKGADHGMYFL